MVIQQSETLLFNAIHGKSFDDEFYYLEKIYDDDINFNVLRTELHIFSTLFKDVKAICFESIISYLP